MSEKSAVKAAVKLTPLGDRVLVKRLEAGDRTKGGLVLPDTAKEKPKEGRVLATGEGRLSDDGKRQPLQVRPNDRILFTSYAGTEVKLEGEDYIIMQEEDILAVIEEK